MQEKEDYLFPLASDFMEATKAVDLQVNEYDLNLLSPDFMEAVNLVEVVCFFSLTHDSREAVDLMEGVP